MQLLLTRSVPSLAETSGSPLVTTHENHLENFKNYLPHPRSTKSIPHSGGPGPWQQFKLS